MSTNMIFVCCCLLAQSHITSMDQKPDNLYAWMIWKTSKEYKISYYPNEDFAQFDLEPTMAEISVVDDCKSITVNNKQYTYERKKNCLNDGFISINLWNDVALGVDLTSGPHYYIYHYRSSEKNNSFLTEKILAIPELDRHYVNLSSQAYSGDAEGTLIMSVLEDGTLAVIVPKKVPEKTVLTYNNNLYDATFNYL